MFVLELYNKDYSFQSLFLPSSEIVMVLFLSFPSSGATVRFDKLSYTVAENEILEVCIMYPGELEHFLELNISLLSDSAGSKLNYCVVCI